jgi:hypothetical protein
MSGVKHSFSVPANMSTASCPAPDAPAVEPSSSVLSELPKSAQTCCCSALVPSLERLCGALETQNERLAALLGLLVTIEPQEPEPEVDDDTPTHDLAGRPITVR